MVLGLVLTQITEGSVSWAPFAAVALLLLVSALVSGSEVAFFSLSPSDMQSLESRCESEHRAARVLQLLRQPDAERAPRHLLATILVLNNLVNIGIILISTVLMENMFPSDSLEPWMQWTLHVAAVTFMIVLFGEVIPKVYATSNGLAFAERMARSLQFAQRGLTVVWKPMVRLGGWLDRKIDTSSELSMEDLEHALELTADGERSEEEQRILEGIVTLGSKDAKQVMTARTDMESVGKEVDWEVLRALVIESGYSRIPVHDGSPDQLVGILHIKDLLPQIEEETVHWQQMIRPAFFVPENRKIDDLMRDFQERKTHIAIVVDEYGGTSGLITLEDVIEEIVGEIADEFDEEDLAYSRLDDRTFLFEAKTALIDVYRVLDLEEETWEAAKGESDTLGGFITEQAGRILRSGERITFDGVELQVDAANARKLLRVKLTLPESSKDA